MVDKDLGKTVRDALRMVWPKALMEKVGMDGFEAYGITMALCTWARYGNHHGVRFRAQQVLRSRLLADSLIRRNRTSL